MTLLKHRHSRGLALSLALILCVGMTPVNVYAADGILEPAEAGAVLEAGEKQDDQNSEDSMTPESTEEAKAPESSDVPQESEPAETPESSEDGGKSDHTEASTESEGEETKEESGIPETTVESEETEAAEETEVTEEAEETEEVGEAEETEEIGETEETEETETAVDPEETESQESPDEVQKFLDAVTNIPEITADNLEEAGLLIQEAMDAWEALVEAGLADSDDIAQAYARLEAAYLAVNEALGEDSDTLEKEVITGGGSVSDYGVTITPGLKPSISGNGNLTNNAGTIRKKVDSEGFYYRCPTNRLLGQYCGRIHSG